MADRHFEPRDVERLIPELTRFVAALRAAHAEATAARERLQAEQQRIGMAGGGLLDQAAWRRDAERMATSEREMQRCLEGIGALGGTVKDLGLGLVDFPHRRGPRFAGGCRPLGCLLGERRHAERQQAPQKEPSSDER